MEHVSSDKESKEDFDKRMTETLNAGFTSLGVALGSKLGLFDLMGYFDQPVSCQEIAEAGRFKERYVREWLGLMVVSEIVDVSETNRYFLPLHRRATLRTAPPGGCQGIDSWAVPMNGAVIDELMECFQKDGPRGIDHTSYRDVHKWRKCRMAKMFSWDAVKSRLDEIPSLMKLLEDGIEVCDMGCSGGETVFALAEKFPKSSFYGIDIADEAIELARRDADHRGLENVTFLVQDMCHLPADWTDRWDMVVAWNVVHDVPETTKALLELHRTLKSGGVVSMIDVNLHTNPADNVGCPYARYIYGMSLFHCMTISLYHENGEGMGSAWGVEKAAEMLRIAGFADVDTIIKPNSSKAHYIMRKPID